MGDHFDFTDSDLIGFFGSDDEELPSCLPPEVEEGNIEYKLKLVKPTASRLEHLITQMKWRLEEGQGEAIYEIGVEDNGLLVGLTQDDLQASLDTLHKMADRLSANLTVLRERTIIDEGDEDSPRRAMEILVRKVPDDQQFITLRVAVLGNVDAGKSTLLGVLTQSELDNGKGRARLNLFRHLHEIQSGRTSSISHEILGFDARGDVVNYSESRTMIDICECSNKLVTLIDLAGHSKYLKTTIHGLSGYNPDFAMLVVSANRGLAGTTKEHLGFALALDVPVIVVVSKIDTCRKHAIERTVSQLEQLLKSPGCCRVPLRVNTDDDAVVAATNFDSEKITPIFTVSCVTGKNLKLLTKFLNVVPPLNNNKDNEKNLQQFPEYQIDEIYTVPRVGTVVAGTLQRGIMRANDVMLLGPFDDSSFKEIPLKTMQRNRLPCRVVQPGQNVTVAMPDVDRNTLRKGMMLIHPEQELFVCQEFQADIYLLFHVTRISQGFQTTVHIGNVCQTASITHMDKKSIKTNERASATFRFIKHAEYIRPGSRLLFREGLTKGMGEVTRVFMLDPALIRRDKI